MIPSGRAVDFLTVTVPEGTAGFLEGETRHYEPGNSGRGFKRSEVRDCLGGKCWRRWEPVQPSSDYGFAYECWEFGGGVASHPAESLAGHECRPSRVDVAFDFECGEDDLADDVMAAVEPFAEARGLKIGCSGDKPHYTRYVGSKHSDRRVRIYRKDVQAPQLAEWIGPTMRLEVILRDDRARAWWSSWAASRATGFAVAAGHLRELTGVVLPEVMDVPEFVKPDGLDEAQALFEFMKQHAGRLVAWDRSGVPLLRLAREYASAVESKVSRHRERRRIEAIAAVGVDDVVALVRSLMNRASPVGT